MEPSISFFRAKTRLRDGALLEVASRTAHPLLRMSARVLRLAMLLLCCCCCCCCCRDFWVVACGVSGGLWIVRWFAQSSSYKERFPPCARTDGKLLNCFYSSTIALLPHGPGPPPRRISSKARGGRKFRGSAPRGRGRETCANVQPTAHGRSQ